MEIGFWELEMENIPINPWPFVTAHFIGQISVQDLEELNV